MVVNVVGWDRDLGGIVEEIVQQDLAGSIGRNGRNKDAPAMLNMLPKFELVPMSRYFMTLADARRPSMMP